MGTITRSFANNITSGGTFDATDLTGTIPASNIADASVGNITDVPALVLVSTVASDPPSPDTGQIWYNTTDKVLRAYIQGADAWATGGNLNTGRSDLGGAGGTDTTTGLAFAGRNPAGRKTDTESYNGSTWTELNDVNSAICLHGSAGTQTSALSFGGRLSPGPNGYVTQTESWDGTSWTTSPGNLNTARGYLAGVGADNTSVLAFGGLLAPGPAAVTESWNGSAWTEVNDLNTGRYGIGGAGNQTAALGFGGNNPSPGYVALTESWNGTSWTEVNDLNTGRSYIAGCGTQTVALSFGGLVDPTQAALTESWNGTSWTEVNDLNLARDRFAGSGTTSSALAFGGGPSLINQAATEEFGSALVTTDLGVS